MRVIDIEIKISRSDLKADASKDKWWRRIGWHSHGPDQPRQWPQKVWKHYYALPAEIWKPDLLDCLPSKNSGVLLLKHGRGTREPAVIVRCERRATPNKNADKLTAEQALDVARLANLRMWEAYAETHQAIRRAAAPSELEA
jgi:hypothetical protein